ncbi:MAG TPA: ABC transporter permease [Candidatus Acidoferrales bacterium]|nr:ABC transporter permease [Candidatus Acidoferrales bacterium]
MTLLNRLRSWLRANFRRSRMESEMDAELRFHIEAYSRDLIQRGVSAQEALRRARLEFGGMDRAKEECREERGVHFLDALFQDLRFAARKLRRNPGFSAVAILTIAIGIGANTAIFSVVNAVLLRPLPYPDADRLAIVLVGVGNASRAPASAFQLFQIRQRTKEFDQIGGIWVTNGALPGEGEPEQVKVGFVTSNFLSLLCARPELGRFFGAEDEAPNAPWAVVLSYGAWARRFGSDPAIIGKSIRTGTSSAVVVGVLPKDFKFIFPGDASVPANVDVFYPVPVDASNPDGPGYLHLIGRLRPGSNFARAQADADSATDQIRLVRTGADASTFRLYVFSMQDDVVRDVRRTLLLLFGGVGFVLLIACANVANLLMARATGRLRETTVRAALGASRGRLVRQVLTENLLLGCLGAWASLGIGWASLRAILAARPPSLANFNVVNLDFRVLAFTFAVAILTSVLFGIAPIVSASRLDLAGSLKGSNRVAGKNLRGWNNLLVSAEVALGFVLLTGAGLLMRTFTNELRVDPGFRAENVFAFQIPSPKYEMLRQLRQNLSALPGVQSVAAVSHLPLNSAANWYDYYWKEGAPPEQQNTVMADHRSILPGYFATIGATLDEGRDFTELDDAAHEHVAIIDDVLAKQLWPNGGAIGKKLNISDSPKGPYQFERDWAVVVGVVQHIQFHSLTAIVRPQIYVPFQLAPRPMSIVIRTGGAVPNLASLARAQVALLDKTMPVSSVAPLSNNVARALSQSRFASMLAASLSAIALLLACIGIYGVLSYAVAQRTGEIGIRMAIGARRADVLKMVLGNSLKPVLFGLAGGFLLSLAVAPLLAGLLFGITPGDPANYVEIVLVVLLVSLVASYLPARRATRIDPLIALRHE